MSDSISAISSASAGGVKSSGSSTALTDATKKKLEAMGIDTSKIKTETDGQTKLKEAQASQGSASAQGKHQPPQGASQMKSIEEEATALAGKMNVDVKKGDKIDDILSNISQKITGLQASAGTDESKKSEVGNYQSEYNKISTEYQSLKTAQSMLSNSLNGLANYNKAAFGLS